MMFRLVGSSEGFLSIGVTSACFRGNGTKTLERERSGSTIVKVAKVLVRE